MESNLVTFGTEDIRKDIKKPIISIQMPNVYFKHGAFYYVHLMPELKRRWERLGTDAEEAKAKAEEFADQKQTTAKGVAL